MAGSKCCCEVVLLRPPSSDLVTDSQGHTPQGNILWIQGLRGYKTISLDLCNINDILAKNLVLTLNLHI